MSEEATNPADRLLRLFERPGRVVATVLRIILALGIAVALILKVYMIVLTDHICAPDGTSLGNTIRCTPALALLGYGLALSAIIDFAYRLLLDTRRRFLPPFTQGVLSFLALYFAEIDPSAAGWQQALFLLASGALLISLLWIQKPRA